MEIKQASDKLGFHHFFRISEEIYKGNTCHRTTEDSIVKLLLKGPSVFNSHAEIKPYILIQDGDVVGRCALINDQNLKDTVQVAFFESKEGIRGIKEKIKEESKRTFPHADKLVIGLNGHLNYGAGILLNKFDETPVFGLPYTQSYYPEYFSDMYCRQTFTYRFPLEPFYKWKISRTPEFDTQGISVRYMNKSKLKQEIDLYTYIDNTSFSNTNYWYWSNRIPKENFELFSPFKPFIDSENLIFAEKDGKPVGFLLWYPDFNQLPGPSRDLNIIDLLKFRLNNPITTARFTEIALLPQYRKSPAAMLMIMKMVDAVSKAGYTTCEGGFIFEENMNSRVMTRRFLERSSGKSYEPYRKYGIFEAPL